MYKIKESFQTVIQSIVKTNVTNLFEKYEKKIGWLVYMYLNHNVYCCLFMRVQFKIKIRKNKIKLIPNRLNFILIKFIFIYIFNLLLFLSNIQIQKKKLNNY